MVNGLKSGENLEGWIVRMGDPGTEIAVGNNAGRARKDVVWCLFGTVLSATKVG